MIPMDFKPFHQPLLEAGILAVEAFLVPEITTKNEMWDHDRLYFVRRGKLRLTLDDRSEDLTQNEILYLPASTQHRWSTSKDDHVALLVVCFRSEIFEGLGPIATLLGDFSRLFPSNQPVSPERTFDAAAVRRILATILREKRARRDEGAAMITGLFIELAAVLVSARRINTGSAGPTAKDSAFALSINYMNERLCSEITIDDLAAIAQLSTRRYLDVFKSNFGTTPKQYIIEQRLEIAKELMLETGSILHSSLDAGFPNLSHFYRTFKRCTGLTPRQYILQESA